MRVYGGLAALVSALAGTEYAFVFVQGALGVVFSIAAIIFVFGAISVWKTKGAVADMFENITLLFVYILLITSLPWFYFNEQTLIPGVYTLVLALCAWTIYSKRLSLKDVGLVGAKPLTVVAGAVAGVPLGVIEYLVLRPAPLFPSFQLGYFTEISVYMLVFVALGEELLFRGLIQTSLSKYFGPWQGVIFSSVIFAVMHTVWRSPLEIGFTFAAGVLLGYTYKKTGSLAPGIAIHTLDNILLLAVMPYLL